MHPDNGKKAKLKLFEKPERIIFLLVLVSALAALTPSPASAERTTGYKVMVNGVELPMDEDPMPRDLTLYIPLDDSVLSALGAWMTIIPCEERECFVLNFMRKSISFMLDDNILVVDGRKFDAGGAPYRDLGLIFFPGKALFEAVGMKAKWDETSGILTASMQQAPLPGITKKLEEIYGIVKEKTEPEKKAEAAAGQNPEKKLAYTYDNTSKALSIKVSGDKTASRIEEKGDLYNSFNIRFAGTLANGYDFQSILRTSQTTDTSTKKGSIDGLSMNWTKNNIAWSLFDIQPKFSRYTLRNFPLQGFNYKRVGNELTTYVTMGKAMKRMRMSNYARYVGGVRVEKSLSKTAPRVLGAGFVTVRDTGSPVDLKKQTNNTFEIDLDAELTKEWRLKAEAARGISSLDSFDSTSGSARSIDLSYSTKKSSWKNTYERISTDFFSETSFFSKGRTELSSLYNVRLSQTAQAGAGARIKLLNGKKTYLYPVSLQLIPLKSRERFTVALVGDFEKTADDYARAQLTKEIRFNDKIGSNKIDFRVERRRNKSDQQQAYRNKQLLTVNSTLSQKLSSEFRFNRERWYRDRQSITRDAGLKFTYEMGPWSELVLGTGRYYNTPQSARTSFSFGYHTMNVEDDWELQALCERQNYRDYNANSFEISYSFFR